MKNIVILGGSYGGISTAHRLLKQATSSYPFKITLVSPNSHIYWNMASPRGLIPGQLTDEQLFQPIATGFEKYPVDRVEFMLASADHLDIDAKKVSLSGPTGNTTLDYDFLVLATGSHTTGGTPFKGMGSTESTKNILHTFQEQVRAAKTIVIAGAGVTGVEVAGELGFEYGSQKKIVLIASGPTILETTPASVSRTAMKYLQDLKIDIRLEEKVTHSAQTPDGRQEITLSGGETLDTDMYIPTFGLVPNSSYMPKKFLNNDGTVRVDDFLKVKEAGYVWAIGDVTDHENSQFKTCDTQSAYVANSIAATLGSKIPNPYKKGARFMGLSIGKNGGTGHFGNIKIPSFVIIYARKTLFIERMVPMINGSLF